MHGVQWLSASPPDAVQVVAVVVVVMVVVVTAAVITRSVKIISFEDTPNLKISLIILE